MKGKSGDDILHLKYGHLSGFNTYADNYSSSGDLFYRVSTNKKNTLILLLMEEMAKILVN